MLPIFELLRTIGDIPEDDYRRTFNLGIGMILVIGRRDLVEAQKFSGDFASSPTRSEM